MNLEYIDDDTFKNSILYKNFIKTNPGRGNLRIRAFAANEAIPVPGVRVIVSTVIDNVKVIFFDGDTDASGMINTLSLPTPGLNTNNMEAPSGILYEVEATIHNDKQLFKVLMYDGVCVVQNIVPEWGDI